MLLNGNLLTPHLRGKLVTLKPFDERDITPAYVGWLNDPALMKYSNQRFFSHSLISCASYLNSFKGGNNIFLAIYHETKMVGTMTAHVSAVHRTADIGLLVGTPGEGFGKDAWSTLMAHLFRLDARKVSGGTLRCNAPMVRIMTGCGMQADGIRIAHELIDGEAVDILHFAKFNSSCTQT
jgi:RimJ/RimL family protein N-acetyltransferase